MCPAESELSVYTEENVGHMRSASAKLGGDIDIFFTTGDELENAQLDFGELGYIIAGDTEDINNVSGTPQNFFKSGLKLR